MTALSVIDDFNLESDEMVHLALTNESGPTTITVPSVHTVTIEDNDNPPVVDTDQTSVAVPQWWQAMPAGLYSPLSAKSFGEFLFWEQLWGGRRGGCHWLDP